MPITDAVLDAGLQTALQRAADRISDRAQERLAGVLAFGRCYRVPAPARSCELLIACSEAPHSLLKRLADPVRDLTRAHDVQFLIATEEEIRAAADVFPVRFLLMQRRHLLLAGRDVVASLDIEAANLRLRVEQELRNLLMRLRRRALYAADDPAEAMQLFRQISFPLSDCLECLAQLKGEAAPKDPRASELLILRAHVDREGPWPELSDAAAAKPVQRSSDVLHRLLPALERLVAEVDALELPR